MTTTTILPTATIRDLHWPQRDDAHPTVVAMLNDPYLAHIAAVELAGNNHQAPVRHYLTGRGISIRNPTVVHPVPDLWAQALAATPTEQTISLTAGSRYQMTINVVPTRSDPHHAHQGKGRGQRHYIADPAEQAQWLTSRLEQAGCADVNILSLVQQLTHSTQRNISIRSVQATATVTVLDPDKAATAELGRNRAYGYGIPHWTDA